MRDRLFIPTTPDEHATLRARATNPSLDRFAPAIELLVDLARCRYAVIDATGRIVEFTDDGQHVRYALEVEPVIRQLLTQGLVAERYGSQAVTALVGDREITVIELILTERGAELVTGFDPATVRRDNPGPDSSVS